jgi:hypothetical protein
VDPDVEKGCMAMSPEAKSKYAWQYYGYPALSQWMASSNDFFVLRRFSPLQVRCLLYLQNEIALKGQQLHDWDRYALCRDAGKGNSGWINQDPEELLGNPRPRIICELLPLLKDYSQFQPSSAQFFKLPQSDDRSR